MAQEKRDYYLQREKNGKVIKRMHVRRFAFIRNWYDDRPTWSYLKQEKLGYPMDRFFGETKANSKNRRIKKNNLWHRI